MDTRKSAADKIRPILQAMERSIDSVRQKRTNKPAFNPVQPTSSVSNPQSSTDAESNDQVPRMKARPKRLASPFFSEGQPEYRSKAG